MGGDLGLGIEGRGQAVGALIKRQPRGFPCGHST